MTETNNVIILQDRYQIISKIASGGMADVFRAHDQYLNRTVAIKILNQQASNSKQVVQKFYKEVEATTRLKHQNVVEVYDVFEDNNRWCIVLELINGYTLKDRLVRTGPMVIIEALKMFNYILSAVQAAHKADIIHRDLKPENILISFDGKIKVSDFGIAIIGDEDSSKNGKIIGTAKYISPEAVQSKATDQRSDIYSLGIMLFEMLIGSTPFNGQNPVLLAVKQVREPLFEPSLINPNINQFLENIIIKATAKNAFERYQSIAQMSEDINKYLNNKNISCYKLKLKNNVILERENEKQYLKIINRIKNISYFYSWKFVLILILLTVMIITITIILLLNLGI